MFGNPASSLTEMEVRVTVRLQFFDAAWIGQLDCGHGSTYWMRYPQEDEPLCVEDFARQVSGQHALAYECDCYQPVAQRVVPSEPVTTREVTLSVYRDGFIELAFNFSDIPSDVFKMIIQSIKEHRGCLNWRAYDRPRRVWVWPPEVFQRGIRSFSMLLREVFANHGYPVIIQGPVELPGAFGRIDALT